MKKLFVFFLTLLFVGMLGFSVTGCDPAEAPLEEEPIEEEENGY